MLKTSPTSAVDGHNQALANIDPPSRCPYLNFGTPNPIPSLSNEGFH
jgi:hypothetical protein